MDTRDIHTELVAALERRGKTRQAGDLVEFCCPRHEDKKPSAWLGNSRWGCHACGFEEYLDTLCTEVGVAPPKDGFTLEDYADLKCFSVENLRRWGVETGRTSKFDNDLVAIPYRDADGKTPRVKFRKASGTFWDPDHGKGQTHLYGLDMLAKAPNDMAVVMVEGESDCHAAWHHKRLAIGVPGANTWKSEWKHLLADREVYVWQEPGEAGANFAALICRDLPNAKVIRGMNGTNDLADLHKAAGGNFGAELDQLMATASKHTAPPVEKPLANGDRDEVAAGSTIVKRLSDVEPEQVRGLWQGRIPLGNITVLDGDPGTGKTTPMLAVAARAKATGLSWRSPQPPAKAVPDSQGSVKRETSPTPSNTQAWLRYSSCSSIAR